MLVGLLGLLVVVLLTMLYRLGVVCFDYGCECCISELQNGFLCRKLLLALLGDMDDTTLSVVLNALIC